jgi:hypothetical protein
MFIVNVGGTLLYLWVASLAWVVPEERAAGISSMTAEPFIWSLGALPVFTAILAQRPDFLKVFLLYSDEYERRRTDTAAFGALGSDAYRDDSRAEARYLHSLGVFSDTALVELWSHDTPRAIFPGRAVGRLDAGDEASFLVLGCGPLARFACTDSIRLRIKDGRVLPALESR